MTNQIAIGDKIVAYGLDNKYAVMEVTELKWDRIRISGKVKDYVLNPPNTEDELTLHEDERKVKGLNFALYSQDLIEELHYRMFNHCSKCASDSGRQTAKVSKAK